MVALPNQYAMRSGERQTGSGMPVHGTGRWGDARPVALPVLAGRERAAGGLAGAAVPRPQPRASSGLALARANPVSPMSRSSTMLARSSASGSASGSFSWLASLR